MLVEVQRLLACSVCTEISLVLLDKLVLLGVTDKLVLLKNGLKGGLVRRSDPCISHTKPFSQVY